MPDRYDRLVYDYVALVHQTHKGIRMTIRDGNGEEFTEWFPKSAIDWDQDEVVVPRWLALDKGLGRPVREYSQSDALAAGEQTPEIDTGWED